MGITDRLPSALWPAEKNLGGRHLTVRYVSIPVFLAFGIAMLAGLVPSVGGLAELVLGGGALFAAGVSLVEARTRTCPAYAALGINTCPLAASGEPAGSEGTA